MKRMKKIFFVLIVVLVNTALLPAQNEGLKYIDRNDFKSYMKFLSSDQMKGRETGSGENDIAAMYIETNLIRFGVDPIPGSDTWLQKIPFTSKSVDRSSSVLSIVDDNGKTIFTSDSILSLIPPSGSLDVTGDLVFAGYGFEDKKTGYSDLKDVDLTDKIVMIMTRNPNISDDPKYSSGYRFDQQVEVSKIMPLFSKKPKALFLVYDGKNRFQDAYSSGLADMLGGNSSVSLADKPGMSLPIKILFITGNTANQLLAPTGKTLRQMQNIIDTEKRPVSTHVKGIKVSFKINLKERNFDGYNVVAVIEGSDPVLKNECIVYSAHFDHIGVNDKGEVFNGADDNASGSIGLLGVADAFSHLKKKPLRTVVFVWVNGEEKGLLGSQYYVSHPVIPIEKTILNINLDMIGRSKMVSDTGSFMGMKLNVTSKDEILLYNEHKSSDLLKIVDAASVKTGVKVIDKGKNLEFGGSDHESFEAKKVPFLFFHSGIDADLHSIRDDADKIDYDKMEKVSRLVFLVGYNVANSKTGIRFDPAK
jgi:hypothetical protein